MLFSLLSLIVGCEKSEPVENIDLVAGIPPVSTAYASIAEFLPELEDLTSQQILERIATEYPHLDEGVVYYLREKGKIPTGAAVSRVEFRYGSLDGVRAESADGTVHDGYFHNQLLASVWTSASPDPLTVIVTCLNGTFMLPGQLDSTLFVSIEVPTERFVIGRGEGLIHHVDFDHAIDLAQRFNLPLFRGREIGREHAITPDQARALEGETDRVQITVMVFEGDQFDLAQGSYTPARRGG